MRQDELFTLDPPFYYSSVFRKSYQLEHLHDPYYMLAKGYVAQTPLMLILAKDIHFCKYQFQIPDSMNNLVQTDFDYSKLQSILWLGYGLEVNVGKLMATHRLNRLMQYVEKHITDESRKALMEREEREQEVRRQLFKLIAGCTTGRPPRMESNPAFLDIDFAKVEAELFKHYHIYLSKLERRNLNTIDDIITHIIFRLRDGGLI